MTRPTLRVADPVMDAAQGRPMVVVATPDETVAEWSERENYDLLDNYANAKFDPDPDEPVVECVYVSDVRSEPSKTYTFPRSRCRLIDVHHADGGRRLFDRVARAVLADVFGCMERRTEFSDGDIEAVAENVDVHPEAVSEARELADVATRFGDETTEPSSGGGFET